jgi:arylsulfatase A-like enzyme
VIKPGTVSNLVLSHQDMLPTLIAAAGEPDIVEKCKKGYKVGNKTFKVHLDGYNLMPYLKGDVKQNPRPGFIYWGDEGDLMVLRYDNWKIHFAVQRAEGFDARQEPFVSLRLPCSSTCGPILLKKRKSPRSSTTSGGRIACLSWRRPGQS